jgi:AraC-like DNA-binding protein
MINLCIFVTNPHLYYTVIMNESFVNSIAFGDCTLVNKWVFSRICDAKWRIYQNGNDGASIISKGIEYPMLAGEIIIIPAWLEWYGTLSKPVRHTHLSFNTPQWTASSSQAQFLKPLIIKKQHKQYQNLSFGYEQYRNALLSKSTNEISKDEINHCIKNSTAHLALALYLKIYPSMSESSPQPIAKALDYINNNISSDLRVEELANVQACAPAHFSRLFSKLMKQSASSYVREVRATRASELLINTNKSIEQIADLCGFCDRFHLSRIFKNILKVSPAKFREQNSLTW